MLTILISFMSDGSFANILGGETWVEGWQSGGDEGAGAPVAPYDGSKINALVLILSLVKSLLLVKELILDFPKLIMLVNFLM